MTTTYFPGEAVALTFPSQDGITAISVTVRDGYDVVVYTATAPIPAAGDDVAVTIPGTVNVLANGATTGVREVAVEVTHATGKTMHLDEYLILAREQLVILENSIVNYPGALLTRAEFPVLIGWDAASREDRVAALKAAYNSMLAFDYKFRVPDNFTWNRLADIVGKEVTIGSLEDLTVDDWNQFPERFRKAMARAQLVEADFRLRPDSVEAKRLQGIVSETIGESSMFIRQSPEIRLPLCRAALDQLHGMIVRRNRAGRVF